MKVLMISTDKNIFETGSAVRERMIDYSKKYESLTILVLGLKKKEIKSDQLHLFGLSRFSALFWKPSGKFDLVTSQDPFETGLIAWRLARRLGAKLELQIHTDLGSAYFVRHSAAPIVGQVLNRVRVLLARFLLPKADHIRVVSQRIKTFLIENWKITETKIEVRPIVVDIEKIKNASITVDLHQKYPQFDKIILMASRLTKEKNIGLAIEAMCEVVKQKPKTGLIIVGSGPELEKLKAKSYNLEASIIFEPWVNQETLASYYKTCDLFLLTSWYEGYGMTLVEAQASGCKIVSTDVGVAREVGAVIVENNFKDIARGIIETLV